MKTDEELRALRRPAPMRRPDWRDEPSTAAQVNYIKTLVEDRVVPQNWLDKIKELADANAITKGKASEIITALKPMPVKEGREDRSKNQPSAEDVPAGRYCIQTGDDEEDLSFYRVRRSRDGRRVWVYRIGGPNEYPVRSGKETREILKRIYRAGAGEAAIRFGQKLGCCSVCARDLTKRISRELGIGPVCGGRYWEDWGTRVRAARASLRERGLDPDELVED